MRKMAMHLNGKKESCCEFQLLIYSLTITTMNEFLPNMFIQNHAKLKHLKIRILSNFLTIRKDSSKIMLMTKPVSAIYYIGIRALKVVFSE